MLADRTLLDIAIRQGGVVRRSQAQQHGFSDRQIRHRCDTGFWNQVGPGLYRLIEVDGHLARLKAAVAALPGAVVSHESAAELLSIPRVRRNQAVVSVHSRTTHVFPGVIVRRNHDLLDDHLVKIDGLRTTNQARTIVDLACVLSSSHVTDVVDDLASSGRLESDALAKTVGEVARRGRPGSSVLRAILEDYADGDPIPQSALERRGRCLLARAGLEPPYSEYPIPWSSGRRFDDAYPSRCVAIEWDGRRWHLRRDAFDADRQRDNEAHVNGWHVYRFTWRDLEVRPGYVVETVRSALKSPVAG